MIKSARISIPLLALCVLLVASLAACGPKTAKEFKSEAGGFSVMTLYDLVESSQTVDSAAGKITVVMYTADQGDSAWIVGYSDYPADLVQAANTDDMLDGGRNGAVSSVSGTLVSETSISIDGHPGRELTVTAKGPNGEDLAVRARMYLVENRLYQVMVVVPNGQETGAQVSDFLNSFKLIAD